jgi:TonB-linked SusC/RagA family outer membrane protein
MIFLLFYDYRHVYLMDKMNFSMKKQLIITALLLWSAVQAVAQSRPVKGRVLDETGEGLPGATVMVKGSTAGTITDVDGNFTIEVDEGKNTLVIRGVGYKEEEITADGTDIKVKLVTDSKELGETVVTALGIKKEKKSLGYSVSEVSGDQIEKSGERNAIQSLASKAPGVQVTSSSGTPGASSKIRIRGNSSFTGNNDPLIVVDGVPIDNGTSQPTGADNPFNANLSGVNESNRGLDINPDDIESVSVMKGPGAATLYGARGANGAIMITTKKGKYGKGKGLGITLNSSVEFNKVSNLPKKQNIYAQGDKGKFMTGNTPRSWGPRMDTAGIPSYDNYAAFYQTGVGFNNSLSINGGNENTIFRASAGNYNTKGIIPNSSLNRTTVQLTAETKPSSWLTVGGSANYVHNEARMVQNGSNVAGTSLSLFRMPASYDMTKDWYDPITHTTTNYNTAYDNPLFTVYRNPYTTFTNRAYGNMYFGADLTKELKLTYKIGVDAYSTETQQIYDIGSRGNDASNGAGQLNKSNTNYLQVYNDVMLRYNKRFGDFEIGGMVGYNYWFRETRYNFMRGSTLTVPDVYNLAVASTLYASNGDEFWRTNALYGEINLSYKSFLYLNLTGRNDWSTTFGKNSNSNFYPNINMSWIFSEHIDPNDILSYGKLRLTASKAGVPPYPYRDRNYYNQPSLTDGNTNGNSFPYLGQNGYMTPSTNQPGGIKPETVVGKEIGLEMRLWKNRINFEASFYDQVTSDIILTKPVSPSSGYAAEYVNAGKMRNRGIELSLGADVVKTKEVTLNMGVSWSKNVSKVLSLVDGVDQVALESGFSSMGSYAIVGQPYGVFYGTAWKRNDAGQLLIDSKGKPIVDPVSKNLGNPNPDWLMGVNGNVTYKGFTLSMLWDIRHGGMIWNGTQARLNNVGISEASGDRERTYVVDGVYDKGTPNEGQTNNTPISAKDYFQYVKGDLGGATENAMQDGSWIRLRSLGLSYRYTFKNSGESKNPFKYAEVGFTGRNLWLKTKYTGVDPETGLTGAGSNISGWDYFNNPGSKSYMFNLKLGL